MAAELENLLENTLNFTQRQIEILTEDGYNSIGTLVYWKHKDVREWCELKTKLLANRGGVTYGDRRIKCLQGLAWWATDLTLRGHNINLDDFDNEAMIASVEDAALEYEESSKKSDTEKPEKFSHSDWTVWEESLYNYLHSIKNSRGIPISYVIRKDEQPEDIPLREREIIYHANLEGNMFIRDSKRVLALLKELTNGTDAEAWMKGRRCGRVAMLALQAHYDGESEGERRKQVARADLDKLHYRNESTFSFEKYVTKLKSCFNVLQKYNVPVYEEEKVQRLLDNINCPNQELKTEVSICRSSHSDTFDQAATYIATVVSRLFPNAQPSSNRYRSRRNVSAICGGRGGRGRGGRGRGGRGRGRGGQGGSIENGVDVSDATRWYSTEEWAKLSQETQQRILNDPARAAAVEQRRKKRKTSAVETASSTQDEQNRHVAAIVNGVINASRHEAQDSQSVRFPVNGSSRSTQAVQRSNTPTNTGSDDVSVITYDHNGNRV